MLRASAGASRGALLINSTFLASATSLGSILALLSALWRAQRPSLGTVWGSLVALGASLWLSKAPWGPLGATLEARSGVSRNALGRSWLLLSVQEAVWSQIILTFSRFTR